MSVKVYYADVNIMFDHNGGGETAFILKTDYDLLLQELKDYREALEFYADRKNYDKSFKYQPHNVIKASDCGSVDECLDSILFGGKLARQILNKYKAKSGGSEV